MQFDGIKLIDDQFTGPRTHSGVPLSGLIRRRDALVVRRQCIQGKTCPCH